MAVTRRFFKIMSLLALVLAFIVIFSSCSDSATPSFDPSVFDSVLPPVTLGTEVYERDGINLDVSSKDYGSVLVSCSRDSNKKYKVKSECGENDCFFNIESNGENIIIPLQFGDGQYEILVYEQIEGTSYSPIFTEKFDVKLVSEPYIYPSVVVSYDDYSDCVAMSRSLCDINDSWDEKLKQIYSYVVKNTLYDEALEESITNGQTIGYLPNPDATLKSGTGICYDYSALVAAMLRTQKIPTRLVMGYLGGDDQYHAWNEVYINGRWVLSDATLDGQGNKEADYFPTKVY